MHHLHALDKKDDFKRQRLQEWTYNMECAQSSDTKKDEHTKEHHRKEDEDETWVVGRQGRQGDWKEDNKRVQEKKEDRDCEGKG